MRKSMFVKALERPSRSLLLAAAICTLMCPSAMPQNGIEEANRLTTSIERHMAQGNFDQAAEEATRQLEIRENHYGQIHEDVAKSLTLLAAARWKQGQYAVGESAARRGLEIRHLLYGDRHIEIAECLNMLGLLLMAQGQFDEAESCYRRSLQMFRELLGDENEKVAMCLNNIGALYGEIGDGINAEAYYRASLDLNRKLLGNDHPRVARNLHNLGFALHGQGDKLRAEKFLRKALSIRVRVLGGRHPDVAVTAQILGQVLLSTGDTETADSLYRVALDIRRATLGDRHPMVAWSLHDLAGIRISQGDFEEAERYTRESLAIRRGPTEESPDAVRSLRLLAKIVMLKGDYAAAEEMCEEAHAMYQKFYGHGDFETLSELAYAVSLQGRHVEAESLLREAASEFESARLMASGVRTRMQWYGGSPYLRLAAERLVIGDTLGAWPAVEMALGRGLIDLIADVQPSRAANGIQSIREGEVYSLERVQVAIEKSEAIIGWLDVELSRGNPIVWGYVIRRNGPVRWEKLLPAAESMVNNETTNRPSKYRDLLRFVASWPSRVGDTSKSVSLARGLWGERIAPLLPYLDGVERLIVVPSREMLGIPVEALLDEREQWVGSRFTVSYASSATIHAWLRIHHKPNTTPTTALLVGDPPFSAEHLRQMELESHGQESTQILAQSGSMSFHDPAVLRSALAGNPEALASLPRVKHSRSEVSQVGALVPDVTVLLGPNASEQQIRRMAASGELKRFDAIHLATHALIDDKYPRRSALALSRADLRDPVDAAMSGERAIDGLLSAEEVARDWNLNAELVTLSGCKTALGKEQGGEGYVGFAHAFFRAGARSLLASLWDVDDVSTSLLMRRFYENLTGRYDEERKGQRGKPMSKACALQEAKEWLRGYTDENGHQPFAHPAYWSAFVLLGDSR